MALQLTRLNVPSLTTDYSAETNAAAQLGKTLGDLIPNMQKQQLAAQKQQLLGSLGSGTPDYNKVGLGLLALGDTQGGAAVLGLGQKAQSLEAQRGISTMLGGAAPPSANGAGPASLINSESGGNWRAQNDAVGAGGAVGHFGRAQFGQARLQDAANAGAIPQGTTPQQFTSSPDLQKKAEAWHFGDIDSFIASNGYDKMVGQSINGVPVTVDGMRAVAHLGGTGGLRKFIESGGQYNPSDRNGTSLLAYLQKHQGNSGPAPQRIAVADPQAAPVQIAQAPATSGASAASDAADAPAPGARPVAGPGTTQAAQAQGFAVPGTSLPPNDPLPRVSTQQLMGIAANPNATDGQRSIAKSVLDNRLKYSDENAPDKREMTRLQTEKLRREVEGEGGRPMTAAERQSYGVREGQPAFIKKNGDPGFGPAGTSITNANTFDGKGETKFNEALGTAQAKRWNGYIEEGDVAQGRIADIQTLRDASRRLGSQGSSANLKSTIGPFAESLGIQIEGLGDIQLYESITNRLAPTLRAPGSGSTSDIEFKGFMRAIGPLSNTPAAREMILDTFEAASRNDLARSEIASRLAEGQINRGQAEKEIRALPNPLEGFRKFREANPDAVGQAIKETGQRQILEKNGPPKITSPDQARSLPSGTEFIDPNGVKRRVP